MKGTENIIRALTIAFLCMLPSIHTLNAVDPSQILQISIDDGDIPDLGLAFNRDKSFMITDRKPPKVAFYYGEEEPASNAWLNIYFYDYDLTTYMSEYILFYEINYVRSYSYRIIRWFNQTNRYELLYEHLDGLYLYGTIEFTHGTTLISLSLKLRKDSYADADLTIMLKKLEEKARELLSIETLGEVHGQITGFTRPMKHIKVSLSDGTITNETTTDAEGNYNFSRPIPKKRQFNLTVTFSYAINSTTYFSLHYQENNPEVVTYKRTFTVNSESDLTQDIALDQALPQYYGGDWAKTFASMYGHFTEALEFYKIGLKVDVNYQLPLDIYTFASEKNGTRYWYNIPGKSYITISADKSIHESVYRPRNREYHEFSHYIMHAMYQQWPAPAPDLPVDIEERNHDGYLNPSTSDSYVEGFAHFMAAVILQVYEEDVGTIPMTPPDTTAMIALDAVNYMYNTQWYGMELDAVSFGNNGKAEEKAIAGILWDLYDDKTDYCNKTPEQMYQEYQRRLPQIQQEYEKMKEAFEADEQENGKNETYPPLEIFTIDDFRNYKYDDDNATLGFEAVWDVIKNFHNDFTSVYNDFKTKYAGQKKAIDEVFIAHAFYAETDRGDGKYTPHDIYRDENHNGKYDAGEYFVDYPTNNFEYNVGEVIGPATNYNRQWRQSVQEVPGYFIKVDNVVPFYLIKVSFPNQFYLDYVVRAWNDNGMVSIPVPPEGYSALVSVIPEGVQCNGPLNIAAEVFQRHYETSLENGYYVHHDFQVTGPIPPYPSMPGDASTDGGAHGTKIPGFEVMVFVLALVFIACLLRRRK